MFENPAWEYVGVYADNGITGTKADARENAHVALDQTEYQKRYDGLTARFDSAKAQLEEIDSAIADKKSRRAAIEAFLDTLAQADLMEKFDPALWCGLVDFVAVYDKDDVRITFKNGQEIKT